MLKRKIALLLVGLFLFTSANIVSASEPMASLHRIEALGVLVTEASNPTSFAREMDATVAPSIDVNPDVEFGITCVENLRLLQDAIDEIFDRGFFAIHLSEEFVNKLSENNLLDDFDRISAERILSLMTETERADFARQSLQLIAPMSARTINTTLLPGRQIQLFETRLATRLDYSITRSPSYIRLLLRFLSQEGNDIPGGGGTIVLHANSGSFLLSQHNIGVAWANLFNGDNQSVHVTGNFNLVFVPIGW